MVEVMIRNILIICFFVCFCAAPVTAAEDVQPRIAGLEGNPTYMALLSEDGRLQQREDSVVRAVELARMQLREDPTNRQAYSAEILQLEEEVFSIRNARGRLIDRINTIEQEWVLSNLDVAPFAPVSQTGFVPTVPDSLRRRYLVDNLFFRENLPMPDYQALLKAQRLERVAEGYVRRYRDNYRQMQELAGMYDTVRNERVAADLEGRFQTIEEMNRALCDSLAQTWSYIFDNKTYAYNYLLDKMGRDEELIRREEAMNDVRRRLTDLEGAYSSDAVTGYYVQKQLVDDYEVGLARMLGLTEARDSLAAAGELLRGVDYLLAPIAWHERFFLDYQPLVFSSASVYNYRNPIPECRIYERGTIYRILLGTFRDKQSPAGFRGVSPLAFLRTGEGRYAYYAGGFETRAEALDAQRALKERGFKRPEVVVWNDGAAANLTDADAHEGGAFRVEVQSGEPLGEQVLRALAAAAQGYELTRVGERMVVAGPFTDKASAVRAAETLRAVASGLTIKVSEIGG